MGARFPATVQTGPGAYPASCTMDTGSFPGVKRPGRGADHPPPSKRRGHERVELYLYSPSGPQWPVTGRTLLTATFLSFLAATLNVHKCGFDDKELIVKIKYDICTPLAESLLNLLYQYVRGLAFYGYRLKKWKYVN